MISDLLLCCDCDFYFSFKIFSPKICFYSKPVLFISVYIMRTTDTFRQIS